MERIIRCKLVCRETRTVWRTAGSKWSAESQKQEPVPAREVHEAELYAVMDGSPENRAFFEATPSAILKLGMYEGPNVFTPGTEYYLDISLAGDIRMGEPTPR